MAWRIYAFSVNVHGNVNVLVTESRQGCYVPEIHHLADKERELYEFVCDRRDVAARTSLE